MRSDPDGDPLTLTVTGVTQDEPVNGAGDGDTAPDAQAGPASNQVYVRGERSGTGDGRVYRIAFTVADGQCGTCSGTSVGDGTVKVAVPRGNNPAVDSGAAFCFSGPHGGWNRRTERARERLGIPSALRVRVVLHARASQLPLVAYR